jgi:hypothetical protein
VILVIRLAISINSIQVDSLSRARMLTSGLRQQNRWSTLLSATLILMAAAACDNAPSTIAPSTPPNIVAYVTQDVAQSLTRDGRFILASPQSPDGTPLISEARARQLAATYVRTMGPFHVGAWQQQRGSAISLAALAPAPRAYFAQSPYAAVPNGLHPSVRKLYGPYYVVPLLEKGSVAVLLAVSAYNADEQIGDDGQLNLPPMDGNAFVSSGIPASMSAYAAMSPEEVVVQSARASKRKVAAVPELVRPSARVMPIFALWKVALDSDVAIVRGVGHALDRTRSVFVGRTSADDLRTPSLVQPLDDTGTAVTVDANGRAGTDVSFRVKVRPGQTVDYEPITVKPESR